jgi:hypothetical protein
VCIARVLCVRSHASARETSTRVGELVSVVVHSELGGAAVPSRWSQHSYTARGGYVHLHLSTFRERVGRELSVISIALVQQRAARRAAWVQLSPICLWSEAAQPYMSVVRSSSALYVCGQKQLSPICLWSEAPCPPRRERPKPYRKECPACTERPPPLSGLRVCPINWPVLSEKRRPLAARYIAYRLSTASSPPRSPSAQAASRWLYTHAAELSELVAEASRCGRRWRCSQRRQTHR